MNAKLESNALLIRAAQVADLPSVLELLQASRLPTDDLAQGLPGKFFVAHADGVLVGVVGLEVFGSDGLLRSLAVVEAWRRRGLGNALVAECLAAAKAQALGGVYLLTTTAADYFRRRGFADIARDAVPPAVAAHPQFRSLCPASAKCLGMSIE